MLDKDKREAVVCWYHVAAKDNDVDAGDNYGDSSRRDECFDLTGELE